MSHSSKECEIALRLCVPLFRYAELYSAERLNLIALHLAFVNRIVQGCH